MSDKNPQQAELTDDQQTDSTEQDTVQEVLEQRREIVEDRRERRRDRYEELATKHQRESSTHSQTASQMGSAIPLGQPILVGHHSEKRDRAYRKRIHGHMDKSIEHDGKADYYRGKLTAMDDNRAISSDDPDALEKLREKLANMEADQLFMREANKLVRKVLKMTDLDLAQQVEKLVELAQKAKKLVELEQSTGLKMTAKIAQGLLTPDFCKRTGFPSYQLSNNNANIKRVKDRIADLERQYARIAEQGDEETTEYPELGLEVVQNNILNRVQLVFDAKPPQTVRDVVKSYGFRWAASEGAWQRQLNHAGINAANLVIERLKEMS